MAAINALSHIVPGDNGQSATLVCARRNGRTVEAYDIKTRNPFAVNNVYFSRAMDVPVGRMNDDGSSLVFGHPQGPTGAPLIAEMIEQLRLRGGGMGLFTGCAASDVGAALVVRIED